jgi:hypothetical protein
MQAFAGALFAAGTREEGRIGMRAQPLRRVRKLLSRPGTMTSAMPASSLMVRAASHPASEELPKTSRVKKLQENERRERIGARVFPPFDSSVQPLSAAFAPSAVETCEHV